MRKKDAFLIGAGAFYALSSFVPLLRANPWWLRVWDFPRLQFFLAGLANALAASGSRGIDPRVKVPLLSLMGAALALDAYRVLPYTRFHPREVEDAKGTVKSAAEGSRRLRLFIANVLQHNRRYQGLLETIEKARPDVVLLLETDGGWERALEPLRGSFPHGVGRALSNEYGMVLFSRLELRDARVNFLVAPDIPSVFARVILPDGSPVALYGVHPRPPRPDSGDTTQRDAELVLVGRKAAQHEEPVIVMGDLNDVAWSHTSRLFRRVSRLLDPRVGRGPFPTFPAPLPWLRFPLDYVFHSDHFRLGTLERPDGFGSDHFAMVAELVLEPDASLTQEAPAPDAEDLRERDETIRRGLAGGGRSLQA